MVPGARRHYGGVSLDHLLERVRIPVRFGELPDRQHLLQRDERRYLDLVGMDHGLRFLALTSDDDKWMKGESFARACIEAKMKRR